MDKLLQEEFEHLDELIRKANSLINPITVHHSLKTLMDPEARLTHYKKHPKCYLSLGQGRKNVLFPICSMAGIEDVEMIRFSLKLADKLYARKDIDGDGLAVIVKKLKRLENKFSKEIPKTATMSHLKAKATKKMDDILNRIK